MFLFFVNFLPRWGFGGQYQDNYEFFCEYAGVNLKLVKEWKSLRAKKEKQIKETQGVA